MRTIKDELDEAVETFRKSADVCGDRYQEHADRYDETGNVADAAQAEYELGRASGYLAAMNAIHRLRSTIVASGADRIPVKGQSIPAAVVSSDER